MNHTLNGIPIVASMFVPDFRMVFVPPRNRREQRKREVIARRRRRAGKPAPTYEVREPGPLLYLIDGKLYGSARTVSALIDSSKQRAARTGGDAHA